MLIGYSVEESFLGEYEDLFIDVFKKVLLFLQVLYKDACNKKYCLGFMVILELALVVECISCTRITV